MGFLLCYSGSTLSISVNDLDAHVLICLLLRFFARIVELGGERFPLCSCSCHDFQENELTFDGKFWMEWEDFAYVFGNLEEVGHGIA